MHQQPASGCTITQGGGRGWGGHTVAAAAELSTQAHPRKLVADAQTIRSMEQPTTASCKRSPWNQEGPAGTVSTNSVSHMVQVSAVGKACTDACMHLQFSWELPLGCSLSDLQDQVGNHEEEKDYDEDCHEPVDGIAVL